MALGSHSLAGATLAGALFLTFVAPPVPPTPEPEPQPEPIPETRRLPSLRTDNALSCSGTLTVDILCAGSSLPMDNLTSYTPQSLNADNLIANPD